MPVQYSPPARQTRSQTRAEVVLTPAPQAPLTGTPAAPQLRAHLERGPNLEGRKGDKKIKFLFRSSWCFSGLSRTTFKGPGEDGEEEQENSVEEEESDGTEGVISPVKANLDKSNQPIFQQSEPSVLAIMQQITHIMANL
ncbi:hypothetical protein O181_058167 [Austropuccinia psidii MF-1]|uniref:Uncharacterized protein n=1 Tax=Austropuccinia psidii MF-1 TaxID=1389203 RepID=A0A9Q3EE52_9BASI|nr:hypothetical protein [Austropuccinia psidii MF-1]